MMTMLMSSDEYLRELLRRYQANFDIHENYTVGNVTYPAYAWFHSFSEKYVLRKEAQLWAIKAYEHVLFIKEKELSMELLEEYRRRITEEIEPELVRNGGKYPEKDHMCTYITFVVLTDKAPSEDVQRAIKKFSFDKGYMFNFRGHSEAHFICADMESGSVYTNKGGKSQRDMMLDVFRKANKGDAASEPYAC